jgi:hypothetical protein
MRKIFLPKNQKAGRILERLGLDFRMKLLKLKRTKSKD